MSQPDKLFDPNKTYLINVWDMPVFVIDAETEEPVCNEDGTVAIFSIPNYDLSYLCDGVDIDKLELREKGDDYDNA